MASLKAVKDRIATVTSTRKITSAMKMIASSKLHKAQSRIENMLPYERRLNRILIDFLAFDSEERSIYTENRVVKSVAIVVFSSNASLVGGFNANVIRRVAVMLDEYKYLGIENIHIYPVGKKVAEAVKKLGFKVEGNFTNLAEKPSYEEASDLARILMDKFKKKKIDKVELLYHHFKNTAVQSLTQDVFLPIEFPKVERHFPEHMDDFIIEPNSREIMESLVPKVLLIKMYTVLLDSNASEHAARTMAMQLATDNANDLLQELNLQYNKTRQQAITNELLDIVGGSFK
jgi:F-type H+-transporting ATPase subunit gamma